VQGIPGTGRAWARVNLDGSVDLTRAKNIAGANVNRQAMGQYCLRGLPFTPQSVVVTTEGWDTTAHVAYGDVPGYCGTGEQAVIVVRSATAAADSALDILVNG
jgi:hypothetical protein